MARAVAYQMQVAAYGGLSAATKRRLREIAMAVHNGDRTGVFSRVQIKPGTQLIRQWQNTTHTVMVLDGGFALDGRTYKSLSAVAKAITSTNWNGYAFFGIKRAARGNKAAAGSKRDSRLMNQPDSEGGCSRAFPELKRKGFACVIRPQNRSPSNARFTPANHRKKDWSRTSIRYMRSGSPARHI